MLSQVILRRESGRGGLPWTKGLAGEMPQNPEKCSVGVFVAKSYPLSGSGCHCHWETTFAEYVNIISSCFQGVTDGQAYTAYRSSYTYWTVYKVK